MTVADVAVFVGLGAVIAGVWGQFGWPWASMIGGLVLLWSGAKLQQVQAVRDARKVDA